MLVKYIIRQPYHLTLLFFLPFLYPLFYFISSFHSSNFNSFPPSSYFNFILPHFLSSHLPSFLQCFFFFHVPFLCPSLIASFLISFFPSFYPQFCHLVCHLLSFLPSFFACLVVSFLPYCPPSFQSSFFPSTSSGVSAYSGIAVFIYLISVLSNIRNAQVISLLYPKKCIRQWCGKNFGALVQSVRWS